MDDRDELPAVDAPPTASQNAARYIRQLIFDGLLEDGIQVPREAVAEALGVSAVPVREALISLSREGWVTIVPNRGAFVVALTEQTVHDHFELYGLVYGLLARYGCERGTPESLGRLHTVVARIGTTEDPDDVAKLAHAFNAVLLEDAASPRLAATIESLHTLVPGNLFAEIPGATANAQRGFAAILAAIEAADATAASAACGRLMQHHGDLVVRELRRRGSLA